MSNEELDETATDMVLLAHVRSAFALSNGTYGSLVADPIG